MRHTTKTAIWAVIFIAISSSAAAFGIGTFIAEVEYTPNVPRTIEYYVVNDRQENAVVRIKLNGSIAPFADIRFADTYWYSNKINNFAATLEREFDLRGVGSATLRFRTRHDLEDASDFGYVQVSTNNGTSWTTLRTYNKKNAGWPEWINETISLDDYAGNITKIRFRYQTDLAYVLTGWMVDDIVIPEIGFEDYVEEGANGWVSNGWVYDTQFIVPNTKFLRFYMDFTIPTIATADYVNDNVTKIHVIEVVEWDTDYLWLPSSYTPPSSASVTGILPPLRLYLPPVPPSNETEDGEEEEKKRTNPRHDAQYITPPYVATYVWEGLQPMKEITMNIRNPSSPVKKIVFTVYAEASDVEVSLQLLKEKPEFIKPEIEPAYQFFGFVAKNINNQLIEKAKITFAVEKSWLEMMDAKAEDVVLSVYAYGEWYDLPTMMLGDEGGTIGYEAVANGLSVFAIRLKGKTGLKEGMPEKEPAASETPAPTKEGSQNATIGQEEDKDIPAKGATLIIMEEPKLMTTLNLILLLILALVVFFLVMERDRIKRVIQLDKANEGGQRSKKRKI